MKFISILAHKFAPPPALSLLINAYFGNPSNPTPIFKIPCNFAFIICLGDYL